MTTEREQARALANRVLERPHGDPDDDLAVLARQFLNCEERVRILSGMIDMLAQLLGEFLDRLALDDIPSIQRLRKILDRAKQSTAQEEETTDVRN